LWINIPAMGSYILWINLPAKGSYILTGLVVCYVMIYSETTSCWFCNENIIVISFPLQMAFNLSIFYCSITDNRTRHKFI
jgi:hypothetical protein